MMNNSKLNKLIEIKLEEIRTKYAIKLVTKGKANFFDGETGKDYLIPGSPGFRGNRYIGFEDGIKGEKNRIGSDYKYEPGDYVNLDVSYGEGYRNGSKARSELLKTNGCDVDER